MYSDRVEDEQEVDRLVADFMTASIPLETYLQQRRQLTRLQLQSITNTINGLKIFVDLWNKHYGYHTKEEYRKCSASETLVERNGRGYEWMQYVKR